MHKRNVRRSNDEELSSAAASVAIINFHSAATILENVTSNIKARDRSTAGLLALSSSINNDSHGNNSTNNVVPTLMKNSLGSSSSSSYSSTGSNGSSSISSIHSEEAKLLSENNVDRKLLWSIVTLLSFASLILLASAFGLIIRHLRRGGAFVKPNSDAFDTKHIGLILLEDHHSSNIISSSFTNNNSNDTTTHAIPKNLVFVTDRLPGDAKINPHALENAVLWQEMYKEDYKMHFFPGSDSIVNFFESEAPHLLDALKNCETLYEQFDFARYVILYYLGGISVDISVTRPLDRLDVLLHSLNPTSDKDQLIAAVDYDFLNIDDSKLWAYPRQRGLGTHVWAVTPKHPILLQVIDLVTSNLLDRDSVDSNILNYGYPSSVLQDPQKAKLLRRTWTTGSGPFSDILLRAVQEQKKMRRGGSRNNNNNQIYYQAIILPMETFMSAHPGGMRFRNIQRFHDDEYSQIIYMDEEDNDNNEDKLKSQGKGHKNKEFLEDVDGEEDALDEDPSTFHMHGGRPANINRKQQKQRRQKTKIKKLPPMKVPSTDVRWKNYLVYDESHLPKDTYHTIAPYTYLIGAVRDASQIVDTPFKYIVQLCCEHGVHVHIVVGGGVEECRARFENLVKEKYKDGENKCGRFELLHEPNDLHSLENRVDRIAYLRDFQREHLRVVLENGDQDDIIVVADIDLFALPPVSKLMYEVNRMRLLHEYDVVCSNGLMHRPYGYYDIYATVLLPDTFLYPVRHRLLRKSWEGEDKALVRSDDEFGEVTSWDILDWIEQQGEKNRKENAFSRNDITEMKQQEKMNPLWTKAKSIGAYSEGEKLLSVC